MEGKAIHIDWYQLTSAEVVERLKSDVVAGLSSSEVNERHKQYGLNRLVENKQRTWPTLLFTQLKSSLVILLVVAGVISLSLGELTDAVAISAIIALNTMLGFWQDFKAERALAELKKLSVGNVTVHRDGEAVSIPATALVPGDVVMLQTGYFVPADCRIVEQRELEIDESALTGESLSIPKSVDLISRELVAIGDRTNCCFMGTLVVRGLGTALVTATGMSTELGKIAGSLQAVESEPTPLQIKLGQLSRVLATAAIIIVAAILLAGLIGGQPPRLMLMTALSMAVALVPEGLPAVATVALAVGAGRMFKRNALIRQLPAVETLGSVSVICSDKTGTLTQNKMSATILDVANHRIELDETTSVPATSFECNEIPLLLVAACLCNDAELNENQPDGAIAVGEPTEAALVEVAAKLGLSQTELKRLLPRIGEVPFNSDRKRMTTLHKVDSGENDVDGILSSLGIESGPSNKQYSRIAFTKGAVDSLLEISTFASIDGQQLKMDERVCHRIRQSHNELARQGTRVLAAGFRWVAESEPDDQLETQFTFVGMIGLADPPRPEAASAVALCRQAGIRPIMITGDHPLTALSIADKIGIPTDGKTITGQQLSGMELEELQRQVCNVSVFARVAPADKLHIVEALQRNHQVVAMTGDGVNDAPALKQASVGVAMGIAGTDVSKQAANVVLLDDNFATIVAAIEQGRNVFDNIRKFVKYAMSGNVGEVLVMTIGVLFGLPLPLLPLQILWVNLVTDGLPGLALAIEPAEKNTMNRAPIPLGEPIFNRRMKLDLFWIGGWICFASLVTGNLFWDEYKGVEHWRTIVFTVLTFAQMANVFACRSDSPIIFTRTLFQNKWLWAAVGSTFLLQLAVVYVPQLQIVFGTSALSFREFAACLAASLFVLVAIEGWKFFHLKQRVYV